MMKSFLLFTVALMGGTVFAATTPAPTPEPDALPQTPGYFFTVDLDPHYQFTGAGALTEEDAAQANCYRFIYNAEGKPEEIEYRRAGVPMPDPLLGVTAPWTVVDWP